MNARTGWLLLFIGIAATSCISSGRSAAGAPGCSATLVSEPFARRIAATVMGDSTLLHRPPAGSREYQWQAAPVWFKSTCLVAIVYSSGDPFFGIVAVVSPAGEVVYSDSSKRATSDLMVTARGHPLFVYNDGWGSGLWTSRIVALYPLASDVWIQTLDMPVQQRISVVGFPASDSLHTAGYFNQSAAVSVRGDTLFVQRTLITEYSDVHVRRDTLKLSVARIEIP